MIDGMVSNENLQQVVTELLIRGNKSNISLVFIAQYYFALPKKI